MIATTARRWIQIAAWTALAACSASAAETALDRYVKKPDPTYAYKVVNAIRGPGYTCYVVDLTSQTWRTPQEVNRPVWKHWLTIVKPDQVQSSTGYLFITGGSVRDQAPRAANQTYVEIAMETHSVAAELQDVPNEPLRFAGETAQRSEDGIIAYTWVKYMTTGDETWPLRLPMTKAAVRAMDTVTAVMGSADAGNVKVDHFVVSGGSKRGWTTWTTAAVDPRVSAIIPASIDLLNVEKSFDHHFKVYGFFAPAVKDYVLNGVMEWTGTPEYHNLLTIEEPYNYRERLEMPKYLIQGAGDQFFLPDSSRFYFDDLRGEKYLRYVPNADHSLRGSDSRESMLAYYEAFLKGTPRPRFFWTFEANGDIRVTSKDKPSAVKLWQATNPEHRDFRMETLGPKYTSTDLQDEGGGVYVGKVRAPPKGWTAYFVEMTYPSGGKYPFKFTTAVRVNPDTEPFPSYQPKKPLTARQRKVIPRLGVYSDFTDKSDSLRPGMTTHVLVREGSEASVRESMRAGRAYASDDTLCDATGFTFIATNNNGVYDLGDHAPMLPRTRLAADLPMVANVRIFHKDQMVAEANASTISYNPTEPGEYRIEAKATVEGELKPWIYSSSIYLDPPVDREKAPTTIADNVEVKRGITYAEGTATDEAKHKLDLYLPKGARDFPVLIFIHGGAWRNGDRSNYTALGNRFASKGLAVVAPSYRLQPGAPHPAQIEDATAAVDWVIRNIAQYGGDVKHIYLSGHSAGGHLSAFVGLEQKFWPSLKGVIALSGVYDVSVIPGFPDAVVDGSPMHHIAAGAPPFLITYCQNDYESLPQQARDFEAALKGAKVPAELVYVPGKNHISEIADIWKDDDPTAAAILRFIEKHR